MARKREIRTLCLVGLLASVALWGPVVWDFLGGRQMPTWDEGGYME